MADIVVLGAGLGGTLAAFELVPVLESGDRPVVIEREPTWLGARGLHQKLTRSDPRSARF